MATEKLITGHLDLWTAAIKRKSGAGRGSTSKVELYGIKKLRELILELAVRGLLVPQDPKDEPASELLKNIAAEKARLVKAGKIKKDTPQPSIEDDEKPFATPNGWEWVRVADIGYDLGQKTPDKNFTYLDVGAIDNRLGLIDKPTVLSADEAPSRARKLVKCGTVIYSTVRPYLLNIAIVEEEFSPEPIASTAFAVVHPFEGVSSGYIYRYLRSPSFVSYVESVQTGIAYPAINDRQFFSGLLPLPPTAEQRRIVAKVDALMALCDQLEQQADASLSAHQSLVETVLSVVTVAADHAQFVSAWQRIAEHFDTLFVTEESIDQLKQTILQLAVMGKLVPQDPNDEPAGELLKKIAAEKAKLLKNGRVRRVQTPSPVAASERPYQLPHGWEWVRLGDCGVASTGKTPSTKEAEYFIGEIPFIGPGQVSPQGAILTPDKFLSQAGLENSTEALPGDVLMVCIGGSIGKAAIADKKLAFNQQINAIRPINISSQYLYFALSTERFYASVLRQASGSATPIINRNKWEDLLVPVSPEAEQYRIVENVGKLMTICDRLKLHLNDASKTQLHLADAIAETALSEA